MRARGLWFSASSSVNPTGVDGAETQNKIVLQMCTLEPLHQAWTLGEQLWLNMAAEGNRPSPVAPLPSHVVIAFTCTRPSFTIGKECRGARGGIHVYA